MNKKKICIIGCGTYGSYLLKRFLNRYKGIVDITVIDIGNEKIKSEAEIGIQSRSERSNVARHGRYFGLGGTSARWGGQILFFDELDNVSNDPAWNEIVALNNRHKNTVVANVLGEAHQNAVHKNVNGVKTGIWLKYKKRNIFKQIPKKDLEGVTILKNLRVVRFELHENRITSVICKDHQGNTTTVPADIFYLTTGAIESCRLLMEFNEQYGFLHNTDLGKNFGDHLSVELFKIHQSKPVIKGISLLPSLVQGSLITRRVVVYANDKRVGYLHPVFNKDVKIFSSLKGMLFGKQKVNIPVKDLLQGVEFLTRFAFSVFVLKKMYAHRNNWSLQLDIEQLFPNNNTLLLTNEKDAFGERIIQINWNISPDDQEAMLEIKENTVQLLQESGLTFTPIYDPQITTNKIEDIYHPVGIIRMGSDERAVLDLNNKVKGVQNLYHYSTAVFPSAKSINPTAAAFCLIEQHLHDFEEQFVTASRAMPAPDLVP